MKQQKAPNKITYGKEKFYHVSSHLKQHDAKRHSNKIRQNGFRFRIVHRKNKYHIYRGQRKRGARRRKKR